MAVGAVGSSIGVGVAGKSGGDGDGLFLEAVGWVGNNWGWGKVREINMGFAAPIGEALGSGSEDVGENVLDGLVVTLLGRAGVVLQQLGDGEGQIGTDDDHGEDEFAHCHAIGETTFDLQDELLRFRCVTVSGFKDLLCMGTGLAEEQRLLHSR